MPPCTCVQLPLSNTHQNRRTVIAASDPCACPSRPQVLHTVGGPDGGVRRQPRVALQPQPQRPHAHALQLPLPSRHVGPVRHAGLLAVGRRVPGRTGTAGFATAAGCTGSQAPIVTADVANTPQAPRRCTTWHPGITLPHSCATARTHVKVQCLQSLRIQ